MAAPEDILEIISVDHYSPAPVFFQLYCNFLQLIENETLRPGDILPTEKKICEKLNISRVNVRRAMEELKKAQVVYRKKAIGTFVAPDAMKFIPVNYGWIPFSALIESRGKTARAETLSLTSETLSAQLRNQLNVDCRKKATVLKRRYYADDELCILSYFYLFVDIDWNIEELGAGSLTKYLSLKHGINIVNATIKLSIDFANREIAKFMGVPIKSPLFKATAINRGKHGEVISGECSYYYPEKAEVQIKVDKNTPLKWTKLF